MMLFALAGTALSAWIGLRWAPSWIAAALFAVPAVVLAAVALRPAIEIHEMHLAIGKRIIRWSDIRDVDRTAWNAPLIVYLTLTDGERLRVVYPGDAASSGSLLDQIQRRARQARIDGIPYRQFWAEVMGRPDPAAARVASAKDAAEGPVKYPMLRPEDEQEVERMFHTLKSAGRIEPGESSEPMESIDPTRSSED